MIRGSNNASHWVESSNKSCLVGEIKASRNSERLSLGWEGPHRCNCSIAGPSPRKGKSIDPSFFPCCVYKEIQNLKFRIQWQNRNWIQTELGHTERKKSAKKLGEKKRDAEREREFDQNRSCTGNLPVYVTWTRRSRLLYPTVNGYGYGISVVYGWRVILELDFSVSLWRKDLLKMFVWGNNKMGNGIEAEENWFIFYF